MFNPFKNKTILENKSTTSKNFKYNKGNCRLEFSLRTDIKQELKDFQELLKIALKEVEEELGRINN